MLVVLAAVPFALVRGLLLHAEPPAAQAAICRSTAGSPAACSVGRLHTADDGQLALQEAFRPH